MKFLLVSDLHKSYKSFKGQDESVSVEWLLGILDEMKPDFLLGAGDWGEGLTPEDISRIISKVQLLTVYGNHENFPLIKPHSLPDGKVVQRGGLKIAGVNGLIGEGKREYMIAPDDFAQVVKKIKRVGEVDVFLAHQPPYLPEVYPWMRDDGYGSMMSEAVELLKPKLFFNGHMTDGCYTYHEFPFGTRYLRVDSSQHFKCYGLLDSETGEITVYEDGEVTFHLTVGERRWTHESS